MKVVIRALDTNGDGDYVVSWPEGWPIPRIGEVIELSDGTRLTIKAVDWFPQGVDGDLEPSVWVVAR